MRVLGVGLLVAAVIVVVLVFVLSSGSSSSGRQMESILQDDQYLLYEPTPVVIRTLNTLQAIGVDRVRVTVLWARRSPPTPPRASRRVTSTPPIRPPTRRQGGRPMTGSSSWPPRAEIGVDFTLTAPGPLWAMVHPAPTAKLATHYRPSADGVRAVRVGRRPAATAATGRSTPVADRSRLPRVSFWTIWNEPNQPGWLAPQWRAAGRTRVVDAPRLYRAYVDAAWQGLESSGHTPSLGHDSDRRARARGKRGQQGREPDPADPVPARPVLRRPGLQAAARPRRRTAPLPGRRQPAAVRDRAPGAVLRHRIRPPSVRLLPRADGLDERHQLRAAERHLPARARPRRDLRQLRRPPPAADLRDRVRVRDQSAQPVPGRQPGQAGGVPQPGAVPGLEGPADPHDGAVPARRLAARTRATRRAASATGRPSRPGCCSSTALQSRRSPPTSCRSTSR